MRKFPDSRLLIVEGYRPPEEANDWFFPEARIHVQHSKVMIGQYLVGPGAKPLFQRLLKGAKPERRGSYRFHAVADYGHAGMYAFLSEQVLLGGRADCLRSIDVKLGYTRSLGAILGESMALPGKGDLLHLEDFVWFVWQSPDREQAVIMNRWLEPLQNRIVPFAKSFPPGLLAIGLHKEGDDWRVHGVLVPESAWEPEDLKIRRSGRACFFECALPGR